MKARKIDYQPQPIPTIPPFGNEGKANVSQRANVIPFPVREPRKELKTPSMKCCKTDMIDWNFNIF